MYNIINKINELEAQTLKNIKSSKAQNTIRAYKSDLKSFDQFCSSLKLRIMPAEPKTISLFITEISKKYKFSTIKRKLAAIKVRHNISGHYIDLKNPIINENLNSIKKKIGIFQKSKKPILINDLKGIVREIEKERNIKTKLRDKALILIGFSGAFRRSELVSIKMEDLDFVKEGVKIFIKNSKTDQFGEGMIKAIPYLNNSSICPVASLKKWLEFIKNLDIKENKVFNMSDKNVALIIKKYIKKTGSDPIKYAGHSLRSGFATSVAENGAEERQIMNMTGHKSSQMVRRYIQESNLFKNNALNKINSIL
jgi:site-specific recombinase XerD